MSVLDTLVVAGQVVLLQGWTVRAAKSEDDCSPISTPITLDLQRASNEYEEQAACLTLVAARVVLATGVRYDMRNDPLLVDLLACDAGT